MKKQHRLILNAIIEYTGEYGFPPTIRELCNMTGYASTCTVQKHLDKMVELGIVERSEIKGSCRTLKVRVQDESEGISITD